MTLTVAEVEDAEAISVREFVAREFRDIDRRFFKPTVRGGPIRNFIFDLKDHHRRKRRLQPHDPSLTQRIRRDIEGN
jgi:hypothetical protein